MNQTLVYLMTESGALVQLKSNSILQHFKSYNILLFYTIDSKTLYNWIGKKSKINLIEQIEAAEQLLMRMHPEMKILRRFTIKEDEKNALEHFVKDIGLTYEDYKDRMRMWDEFEISIYSDIQKLKIEENNNLMLNKLENVLEISAKIIELAKQLHDTSLIEEKTQFIKETKKKLEIQTKRNEVMANIGNLVTQLKNSINTQDVEKGVTQYNQICLLYKSINMQPSSDHQEVLQSYEQFYHEWEQKI